MSFRDVSDRRCFDLTHCYYSGDEHIMESQCFTSDMPNLLCLVNRINPIILANITKFVSEYRFLYPKLTVDEVIEKVYNQKKINVEHIDKMIPNGIKYIIGTSKSSKIVTYVACIKN